MKFFHAEAQSRRGILILLITLLFTFSCEQPGDVPTLISISSPEDMAKIGVAGTHPLSGIYQLENDIMLADWTPIGGDTKPFTGSFNGNGKTITLESFNTAALNGRTHLGIFSYLEGSSVSKRPVIENLTIHSALPVNAVSETGVTIGLLAGRALNAALINKVNLTGNFYIETLALNANTGGLGGLVGAANGANVIIQNCNSTMMMDVKPKGLGYLYVGGFAGLFDNGASIVNCHYDADIIADNIAIDGGQIFLGGISNGVYPTTASQPLSRHAGSIRDCSYQGTLTARNTGNWTFAGGIAGTISGNNLADNLSGAANITKIERSFAGGTVSVDGTEAGFSYVGGIVGYNYVGALVSQCYFNGTILGGSTYGGGIAGYNAQTASFPARVVECWTSAAPVCGQSLAGAEELRSYHLTTPQDERFFEGWDFAAVWKIGTDGYPALMWED